MTKRWSEIRDLRPVPDDARARAHQENLAEDFGISLADLRRFQDMTQVEIAHRLLVTQPTISEIERTEGPSVPTVRRYVEALGGRLELVAVFDDGRRIPLDLTRSQSAARVASRGSKGATTSGSKSASKSAKGVANGALSRRPSQKSQ